MILRLWVTPSAQRDLDGIQDYLLAQSLHASMRVRSKIEEAFMKLRAHPNLGHWRDDLVRRPYLVYRVYSYLLIYKEDRGYLRIARVIHAARDVRAIMEDDESGLGSD